MDLKSLFDDDRAVSPVIGVILMVAITVILAAVIGTFVLGLGDQVSQQAPQATIQFDYDTAPTNTNATITHGGGDQLENSTLSVSGLSATTWGGGTYSAGDTIVYGNASAGAEIRLIWSASGSTDSSIIGSSTAP